METKKVIALIRTSTEKQEIESQTQEIVELIKSNGYTEKDIIVVGCAGASAIKVDDAYKKNLQTVYNHIQEGNISAVYAWAIDRIGRNEIELFTFKDVLVKNKVQLVIKNPDLKLLNSDGTVNSGVELAFSLFATLAKQEMEAKKARFSRAKKRNAEKGFFNGGKVAFGYTTDEYGKIIINEEEAEIVRLIFNLYNSGKYSQNALTQEIKERGLKRRSGVNFVAHTIRTILENTAYIGYTVYNGVTRKYPAIISKELFESVQARKDANKQTASRSSKHYYLASRLIVCKECGARFSGDIRAYHCHNGIAAEGLRPVNCNNKDSISIKWMDALVLHIAKGYELNRIYNTTESTIDETKEKININNQKIHTLQETINKANTRKQRIALMFINEQITEEIQHQQSEKLKIEVADAEDEIKRLKETNEQLTQLIINDPDDDLILIRIHNPLKGVTEDKETYDLVHRYIKEIHITGDRKVKNVEVKTVTDEVFNFKYKPFSRSKFKWIKDGEELPILPTFVPPML